ncbi:MAG: ornithine cyclodeaminase family protein [Hydrogenophaga sp.]|nr:ornithine cyclodeaminase family protein [Hydrogenophaga sp.]
MRILSENDARQLVSMSDALIAVEAGLAAMAHGHARNYPVVREVLGHQDAVFGVKTGADTQAPLLGLKAGGYWPHNGGKGHTNHQSATVLFDPETGRASAVVSANYLTGVRTGAASAIATRWLSRPDSVVLAIIGTGAQSAYQLQATVLVRPILQVRAWDPMPANLERFGSLVREMGLDFIAAPDPRTAVQTADVLITATPSSQALVDSAWVRPGTHISAMGADTRGKQELDPALVARCALFHDELAQAISIGECQHAYGAGLIDDSHFRGSLGEVVAGLCPGRRDNAEVTLFDGTGVALQDLVVARLALTQAELRGVGSVVDY